MEMTPATPTPKRPRAKKSAAAPVKTMEAAASTGSKAKPAKHKANEVHMAQLPSEDLSQMIATAAYYLAVERSFTPGHEMEDWLKAEQQVLSMYR